MFLVIGKYLIKKNERFVIACCSRDRILARVDLKHTLILFLLGLDTRIQTGYILISQNHFSRNFIINFVLSSKKFQKINLIAWNLFIHSTFRFILIKINFQPISQKKCMLFMRLMVYRVSNS